MVLIDGEFVHVEGINAEVKVIRRRVLMEEMIFIVFLG